MFATIKAQYYWNGLWKDAQLYCKQCTGCLKAKKYTYPKIAPLHSLEPVAFGEKLLVDISGPFCPSGDGNFGYVLMVTESVSMYIILVPLKSVSAESVAYALYHQVFTKISCTHTILLSDRGSSFCSTPVNTLCELFIVKQSFAMTARLTTISQVKLINKLVYNYLRAVCEKEKDWLHHLSAIAMGHNSSSIAGSRIFSPHMILPDVICLYQSTLRYYGQSLQE